MMSRDFFSVSSILHAVKSAAAAASWSKISNEEGEGEADDCLPVKTHNIAVLGVCMDKPELVVIDNSRVKRPDRPIRDVRNDPTFSAESNTLQSKRLSDAINPLYSSKSKLIFFCLSDAGQFEAFLNGMLKDVWLGHLNKRGWWTSTL